MATRQDPDRRRASQHPAPGQRLKKFTTIDMGLFAALLIFPAFAGLKLSQTLDIRFMAAAALCLSAVTFLIYRSDKQRAQSGDQRTPEATLHFLEFLGGWPGAWLAQRAFRHKIVKTKFQVEFWAIIVLHQLVMFDYVHGWRHARGAIIHALR